MPGLKERIGRREVTIGSWVTLGHPGVAEMMAQAGFDWLTVEMEHSSITLQQAEELIRVIDLCGVVPLVRVGENNSNLIKRVMDAGAHGVIVPMVNSVVSAEAAVAAVKYPPVGSRGVGLARAQRYGLDFESYRKWAHEETIVIVQIEHIAAVERLADILAVPDVDGFIVGPYDLSGSLGIPGEFEHPLYAEAMGQIDRVAKEIDAVRGFHSVPPQPQLLIDKIDEGYTFLAYSDDFLFLSETCRGGMETIKHALRGKEGQH
jgi:2-keto-3-deoxy-L-rhamnonate aldolase RhmA